MRRNRVRSKGNMRSRCGIDFILLSHDKISFINDWSSTLHNKYNGCFKFNKIWTRIPTFSSNPLSWFHTWKKNQNEETNFHDHPIQLHSLAGNHAIISPLWLFYLYLIENRSRAIDKSRNYIIIEPGAHVIKVTN